MQVETYEIEETGVDANGKVAPEVESEARALIESLGLEGQQELLTPATEEKPEGERIPYPQMSPHEIAVYRAVFPQATPIKAYSAGMIPVRVLQVARHGRDLFEEVQVWHKRMRDPDPILVGIVGKSLHETSAGHRKFLLARWGDALRPFADLVEEARGIFEKELTAAAKAKAIEVQDWLRDIGRYVEDKLNGRYVPIY